MKDPKPMTKNKKVELNRSNDLESVDQELDEAIERLTSENDKVVDLLAEIEAPPSSDDPDAAKAVPEQSASTQITETNPDTPVHGPESTEETSS